MLDLEPSTGLVDACREAYRLDTTLLRNLTAETRDGLRVLTAPRDAIQAQQVDDSALARVIGVARRAFDYVIVDTFPAVDAVAVAILDLTDLAYVVTSDLVPIVQSMPGYIEVVTGLGVPNERLRVVLNQPYPNFAGRLGAGAVAERLGREIDHQMPFAKQLLSAANLGRPYVLHAPKWHGFGKKMVQLVREIESLHEGDEAGVEIEPRARGTRAKAAKGARASTSGAARNGATTLEDVDGEAALAAPGAKVDEAHMERVREAARRARRHADGGERTR
jgi:pilus assembly protein CpaE